MSLVSQKSEAQVASPLLDEILTFTRLPKEDDSYYIAKNGVKALLEEVFKHDESEELRIDKMFVDEGFGSLDDDSLRLAITTLQELTDGNRLVGIISHVRELKERISKQIVVTKNKTGGSTAEIITD